MEAQQVNDTFTQAQLKVIRILFSQTVSTIIVHDHETRTTKFRPGSLASRLTSEGPFDSVGAREAYADRLEDALELLLRPDEDGNFRPQRIEAAFHYALALLCFRRHTYINRQHVAVQRPLRCFDAIIRIVAGWA